MFTHCPHCDTCFRVTPEHLKAARGEVRCGRCFGTFNALEHLVDNPPEEESEAEKTSTPTLSSNKETSPTREEYKEEPKRKAQTEAQIEARSERSQLLVEEIQSIPEPAAHGKNFFLPLMGIFLFSGLLAGQYGYFNLQQLAKNTSLRPALSVLCKIADCKLPLMEAPHLIKLADRDIHSHPKFKDVLQVKARLTNTADFVQSFPTMELKLQDITGHPTAGRRFKPSEYLAEDLNIKKGLVPQQSVGIILDLEDPGAEAVGFEFDFL